jgi:DNA adenine methylase
MKAPFPYMGGKSRIAPVVWEALGDCASYIEPFFGSGAVLLNRPGWHKGTWEIANDLNGFLANVWRSLQFSPDETARWCDWPTNHADMEARRQELIKVENKLVTGLLSDPEWHDPKMAGYWLYVAGLWIGSGMTTASKIPHLTHNRGAASKIPHLARNRGAASQRPHLTGNQGVASQIPHLTGNQGVAGVQDPYNTGLWAWFREISERLRYVRVVVGEWDRVLGGNWQDGNGLVGIFLDPPYSHEGRWEDLYHHDSMTVGKDVEAYCLKRGDDPNYRIVVAGYDGEYKSLEAASWRKIKWKAGGGYGNQSEGNENCKLERLWLSPHCLMAGAEKQVDMFGQK